MYYSVSRDTQQGKRIYRKFANYSEAKLWGQQERVRIRSTGNMVSEIEPEELIEGKNMVEQCREQNVTLWDAVEFYCEHLDATVKPRKRSQAVEKSLAPIHPILQEWLNWLKTKMRLIGLIVTPRLRFH